MERRSPVRRALGWLQVALTIAVLVFWFFELRPQSLGGPASYALVSGHSMDPVYHTGDVVIVHRHAQYHIGQIVAYRVPKGDPAAGDQVIHRLIGGNGKTGFIVQGDNRTAPDVWHPKTGDVVGSAWVHIPHAGIVVRLLHTPLALAGLAALIAMATVLLRPQKKQEDEEPAVAAEPAAVEPPPAPASPVVAAAAAPPAPSRRAAPAPAAVAEQNRSPVEPAPHAEPAAAGPERSPAEPVVTGRTAAAAAAAPADVWAEPAAPASRRIPLRSETADELRRRRFGRALFGFARGEVAIAIERAAARLEALTSEIELLHRDRDRVSAQLERETQARVDLAATAAFLQREHERLRGQLERADVELERRRALEASLMRSLIDAERAGADLRRHALEEVDAMLAQARAEARAIGEAARDERERTLREIETVRATLKAALDAVDEAGSAAAAALLDDERWPTGG